MTEEILKVEHLNKFYDERQVLHNINFSLKKGEVLTLLGPSGSGKSTLLRTLNGLEDYKNGSIYFHEKKIDPSPKEWQILRQKIGMVFQSYDLFPNLTVIENVLLAPVKVQKRDENEVKEEAIKLLKQVGLEQYLNAYPRELSGGQKQRVAIVRALAMKPEIMLLDEITASLDPEMVRGIEEIVELLSKRDHMTMIIVTHQMNFASRIADEVLFLEDGHILEDTPGKEFFNHPQTQRAKDFLDSMDY
ncbi:MULTISPECIES: amino acid ABC transporter ATP-binding protein [Lactobacillus]|jgi:polar amino acid transport system ATP-binding protein|uniref:ABC-type amino acid transport system, permease n=1 Tax=Lactobacillus gallinarum DSM 10532 = JCM 2011 TaxID=1423748 RepID=A0A0R1NHT1_9LACO|nr:MULTISPECIES: amino acid ABC transporter ATP-binding protein [Lactobacillus]KRL19984.1 ABC-type amino acid transport system, permease [Lactobacillus gallinarum DSM 10532 = JCM 2011]MBM6973510.1 amino acid ABC transporter ATP-binding protein [Lactobacillus gallinarum]MCC9271558.1 amino acid ABC transporter ATP-binding protein [Lactobacillus gallinarum]MDM8277475.1 amino acid ABC transporter ATP-binding protein [Lactobacillus gallinarum]OUQ01393.1 glutamine ABC transporter ATP-binding protein